ncbi:MAG: signal peptidase II, partial [Ignavibacteriaceae bacterium]|nr:signal peptidase II [Ignavibacteriaceae bacterium]
FNFTLFGRSYERWPIFNIADASVTVGVLILLFFYKKHQEDDNKAKEIQGDVNADDEVLPPSNNLTNDVTDKVNDEKLDGETDKGKEISL